MQVQAIGIERPNGTIIVGLPPRLLPRKYQNRAQFLDDYPDDANLDEYELRFDEVNWPTIGRVFQVLVNA